MVPLLGLFLLLPVSLATRIHGLAQSRSIQKRPSVETHSQQQQDGPLLRLPMSRRPPKFTKKGPIGARNKKAGSLARLGASKTHHTRTHTSSAKSTPTPIAANTSSFFQDAAYGIDLWIGNYPQRVTLDFDTGSSETWVSPPCTGWEAYPDYEALCRLLGTYIPEQSSTMIDNKDTCPPSWIMYGSGDVYIAYYQDDFRFTDPYRAAEQFEPVMGPVAEKVRFGLAVDAENMPSGIFGAAYGAGYNQDYNSVIDDMHEQGLIASKDFSVALGSVGGENGEVIFGGIDLAKFTGELHEIEISHQLSKLMDGYYRYWINVTSIGVTKPGSCETVPVTPKGFDERFLPDTGTSLTYMPSEAFDKILEAFPDAQLSDEGFGYTVDCSHRNADGTIDYTFPDGFTARVPFSEFIFLVPGDATTAWEDTCIIGAVPTESLFILGDTFLRAVYAVFSQEHHKVYLAQYQDCGNHVIPSKGKKNKGLQGDCHEAGHGVGDTRGRHYGYPTTTSAAAGACTSYSTAPHPKWSTTSTDDSWTEIFRNTGAFRPMIQTDGGQKANRAAPTSVRSAPGPPWSGNVTSSGQGTAGSTGFIPVPTGGSSSGILTTVSFEPVTLSNSTVPGTTATVSQFTSEPFSSSSTSTRDDVPTSSKTRGGPTITLTVSSSCAGSSSSSTAPWFTWETAITSSESSSSSSYSWFTSSSSSSSSETPVVTIPVQPHETIVVKLQSTTYTIVDGTTVSDQGFSSSSSRSSSFDYSSWLSSLSSETGKLKHHTSTSSESWDTSFSWGTLSFTTISDEPSTTSTKKKHTTTSSTTHKKTSTTSTDSWSWETSSSSSSSSIDAEAGGYLTSWFWNPTGTSDVDPFYTSSSTAYDADDEASSSWGWESSITDSVPAWSPTPSSSASWPGFSESSSASLPVSSASSSASLQVSSESSSASSPASSESSSLPDSAPWSSWGPHTWSDPGSSAIQSSLSSFSDSWSWDLSQMPSSTTESSWIWGTAWPTASLSSDVSASSSDTWSWDLSQMPSSTTESSWSWGTGWNVPSSTASESESAERTAPGHRHHTTTAASTASLESSASSESFTWDTSSPSFVVSAAASLTTTVIKEVTPTVTMELEKRQLTTTTDKPTVADDTPVSSILWTTMVDTPLSFPAPDTATSLAWISTVAVIRVETLTTAVVDDNKDFYIPPSSLHIPPFTDAASPSPAFTPWPESDDAERTLKEKLEKRVYGTPGDGGSGYDSGYESGFEAGSRSASGGLDGECDFMHSKGQETPSGEVMTSRDNVKAQECLRAMEAHRNKGRSVAFCKSFLAVHEEEKKAGVKIPRYLQAGCFAHLEEDSKEGADDGRLISQACKCLMSSPGAGASSTDHVEAEAEGKHSIWGSFVQGVLRRG